jgi:hypothetical protein
MADEITVYSRSTNLLLIIDFSRMLMGARQCYLYDIFGSVMAAFLMKW